MPLTGLEKLGKMRTWYAMLMADVPRIVGNEAVNYFRNSFQEQGWTDVTEVVWKPLSPKTKKRSGSHILIESGNLIRSIHIDVAQPGYVRVIASAPYAKAHNEGFDGIVQIQEHTRNNRSRVRVRSSSIKTRRTTSSLKMLNTGSSRVKAHQRKMSIPQRKFMGNSHQLVLNIKMAILKRGDEIWKKL